MTTIASSNPNPFNMNNNRFSPAPTINNSPAYTSRNGYPTTQGHIPLNNTPLAPPRFSSQRQPSLSRSAHAGAYQNPGQQYSQGVDPDVLAAKMAGMGLNQNEGVYMSPPSHHSRPAPNLAAALGHPDYMVRLQQDALLLQDFLSRNPQCANEKPIVEMRESIAYYFQQHQQQQQIATAQAQALLALQVQAQSALAVVRNSQNQQTYNDPRVHLAQQKQMQQMQLAALQQLQQQQYASASEQRSALSAQVQANLAARTRARTTQLDDNDVRARFESAPNINQGSSLRSPFLQHGFDAALPVPHASGGADHATTRLSSASSPAPGRDTPGSLSALLSRRTSQPSDDTSSSASGKSTNDSGPKQTSGSTAQTSPISVHNEQEKPQAYSVRDRQAALGHGRPPVSANQSRAWSTPAAASIKATANAFTPRAATYAGAALAIRQPVGPPGSMDKLKEENFKTQIRKKASQGLGMLGRRIDSPVL